MIHQDSENRNRVTSEYSALWQRIQAFSLDQVGSELPFSRRLARPNGWPPDYTRRVIEEYKRFVFWRQPPVTQFRILRLISGGMTRIPTFHWSYDQADN